MKTISKITMRRFIPLNLVVIALIGLAWLNPLNTSGSYALSMSPQEAHQLKANLMKGSGDYDSTQVTSARSGREGQQSSYSDQLYDQRAYPAAGISDGSYPNALNQYSLVNDYSLSLGWRELGPLSTPNANPYGSASPSTVSGRATAIAVLPSSCSGTTCSTVFLGTANGGVWKTVDSGATWTEIFDHQISEAVGAITLAPQNPNIIFVGTGESNNSSDSNRGAGIFKTVDGGIHWTRMGFNEFVNRGISNIIVDPSNSNNLYVGSVEANYGGIVYQFKALGFPYYSPPVGFWRSTDGGSTWTLSNPGGAVTLAADGRGRSGASTLIMTPSGKLVLGILKQGIYTSTDGGMSWTKVTAGLETSGFDRIALASGQKTAGDATSTTIYAAFGHKLGGSSGGPETIYKSTTDGASWSLTNNPDVCSAQCWYDMPLAVDPMNDQVVYAGGMANYGGCAPAYPYPVRNPNCNAVVASSTDGGATWRDDSSPTSGSDLHPDDHVILVPQNGGVYTGVDGGLYHSTDGGVTWASLNNGIGSLQFTGVAINSNGTVFAGTQDNGTFMLPAGSTTSTHIQAGDGGFTAADPNDPTLAFDEYYGTTLDRYSTVTKQQTFVASFWCDYFCFGGGLFYQPVALGTRTVTGASASNDVFAGTYRLWRSQNGGGTDGNNDGDATNDPSDTTDWTPITPNNVGTISAIAVSPTNPNIVAFGTTSGKVYYTTNALAPVTTDSSCNPFDGTNANNTAYDTSSFCNYVSGINWTRLDVNASGSTLLPGRYVTSVTFQPNTNKLFVTYSGFNQNTPGYSGHLFATTNPGANTTWTNLNGSTTGTSLPDVPSNSVVVKSNGHLFVAADYGVFMSLDGGNNWYRVDYGLANAPVYQLSLSPSGNQIYAATHGRGIWYAGAP